MATFQDTREQTEQKVMVHLLSEIEKNPSFTQRHLAGELNIALGLMNQYLKRCITKGWVRASQISPRRITYFLTADGFKEKSLMVKDYLARSMTFFKTAKAQCESAFNFCKTNNFSKIALIGSGDLSDIAKLVALGFEVKVDVIDISMDNQTINNNPSDDFSIFKNYDALIITDTINPQKTYDLIKNSKINHNKLILLDLLHISKGVI